MSRKLTRRELLKAMAVTGGGLAVAALKLADDLAAPALAQAELPNKTYLPLVRNAFSPAGPTPTPTVGPTPMWTPGPTPPYGAGLYTDGYGGNVFTAKDALISTTWPSFYNGGAHNNFQFATNQRSLLEFTLSGLPASARCLRATLYLYHSYGSEGGGIVDISVHSISHANAGWHAGNKNIKSASRGECCWDAYAANGSGGVSRPWAGSPGLSTPGVDYETPAMGVFEFNGGSQLGTEFRVELDPDRVNGWFGLNNTNYGIILIAANMSGHVAQADNPETRYRPKLVVEFA